MSKRPMTVRQAIELLKKIGDKDMALMIDCPFCGHGNQLDFITECVVLQSRPSKGNDHAAHD